MNEIINRSVVVDLIERDGLSHIKLRDSDIVRNGDCYCFGYNTSWAGSDVGHVVIYQDGHNVGGYIVDAADYYSKDYLESVLAKFMHENHEKARKAFEDFRAHANDFVLATN